MRGSNILVAVAHEEICAQLAQIQLHLPNSMRAIHAAQHAQFLTCFHQSLERHAYPRRAHDGVEQRDLHPASSIVHPFHGSPERRDYLIVLGWPRVGNLNGARGRDLGYVRDGAQDGAVSGGEGEDVVIGGVGEVAEDGVYAGCGVGDEDGFFGWHVEELGGLFSK